MDGVQRAGPTTGQANATRPPLSMLLGGGGGEMAPPPGTRPVPDCAAAHNCQRLPRPQPLPSSCSSLPPPSLPRTSTHRVEDALAHVLQECRRVLPFPNGQQGGSHRRQGRLVAKGWLHGLLQNAAPRIKICRVRGSGSKNS